MPQVLVACAFCLVLAATAAGEPNWGTWAEEARKQHPLAGSFYLPQHRPPFSWAPPIGFAGKFEEADDGAGWLYRPLPPDGHGPVLFWPKFLLLGEVHDNPMHHQVRKWLIENRTTRQWRGAVVFEQIRTDQQPALDQFKALAGASGETADDLFRLLDWDKSGWPPAAIYKPLFEAVVVARLPIYAGELPRDRVRAIARGGTIDPEERARLKLDNPMPPSLAAALDRELADGHCGVLPPEAIGGMAEAQRYRDAHLADALLSAQHRHGAAILIAGNGHVRSDRGVPWHIRLRAPETRVTSVVIVEVEEGKTDPKLYLPRDPDGKPAADLLIFTPRAERGDPCEGMRKGKR